MGAFGGAVKHAAAALPARRRRHIAAAAASAGVRSLPTSVTPVAGEEEAPGARRTRRRLPRPEHLISALVVLGITLLLWHRTLPHATTWSQSGGGEEGLYLFWLGHFPWAVTHGHDPLLTSAINLPAGANATWNTSVLTPAALLAPVTLLGGVVLAFNVAVIAAMAGTAGACVAALWRFVQWWPAALLGGCLAGFSPFVVVQARGHLNIFLVAVPALLLLVGHEMLVRQRARPVLLGLLLGVLVAAQFGTGTEFLASAAVLAVVGAGLLALLRRAEVTRPRVAYAARSLGIAVATGAVLLAFPLYQLLAGPQHLTSEAQNADRFSADLLSPVVPTANQLVAPTGLVERASTFSGNFTENTAYLGLPLLLAVAATVVLLRRRTTVRWFAVMAGLAFVLSLGKQLRVDGHRTAVPLPFALLAKVPLLSSAAAVRYSFYTALFCAGVLAVGLDALVARARSATRATRATGRPGLLVGTAVVATAAVLVPLLPSRKVVPYAAVRLGIPAYFTGPEVQRIPAGSGVVTYPYLSRADTTPMTWQAVSGYRYRQMGIYGFTPDPATGRSVFDVPTATSFVHSRFAKPEPSAVPATSPRGRAVRTELRALGVCTVLVSRAARGAGLAQTFYTDLLGHPPVVAGGVAAFYDACR